MKKTVLQILMIFITALFCFSLDLQVIDDLSESGKYREAMKKLQSAMDLSKPDPAVIWRLGRSYYFAAEDLSDKGEKIAKCEQGMQLLKPHYNIKQGSGRDRANVIYWYAILSSYKSEAKGIFDSLGNLPNLFKYCDDAIRTDGTFGDPYYLKGMIGKAVPMGKYGDKFVMAENFSTALRLAPDDIWFLVDSANGFIVRNWDIKKKKSMASKMGRHDGTPQGLSDREYAEQLLNKAIKLYRKLDNKTFRLETKYQEAQKLLKKIS